MIRVWKDGVLVLEVPFIPDGDFGVSFGHLNIYGEHFFDPPYRLEVITDWR